MPYLAPRRGPHAALPATAAALVGLVAAPPSQAQETVPQADVVGEIDAITVTARRRDESLLDVPVAVSAFSADQLTEAGAIDITTLQQTVPNLTLQVARGSNSTLIAFIRGVGQQDPLWGFEPGVGLYVDDVYIARPQGAVLDIYDIERIEVLRGPQGTLYGRNTIGGAVKYVTARMSDNPRLDATVNLGSYSQRDVIVSASTPVGSGFAIGGSAAMLRRDGYGENLVTGDDQYDKDIMAYRLTTEWTPTDDLFLRLSGDFLDDESNARHGHREIPGSGLAAGEAVLEDRYDNRGGIGDDNDVETRGASLLAQWNIDESLTFKWITAWREGDTDTLIDFDAGPTPALDVPAVYDDNQTTQELQLLYEGERMQAVAGLYYLDGYASGAFDTILGLANLTIATSGQVETESYAAFADVSFDLSERWSASVGGRYTRDEKTGFVYRQNFTGIRSPLFGNPAAAAGLLRTDPATYDGRKLEFTEFTPRASVRFKPTDEHMLYFSYSEGFKSGGFDMRGDAVLFPETVEGYQPEHVDTYELGAKASLADGRVNLYGAIFYSDYSDQQVTSQFALPGPTIVSFVDNVASSTIQGAELEGAISFSEAFSATFAFGYIDASFDEFVTFDPVTGTRRNLAGERDFQNTPNFTGALSFTYRLALSNGGEVAFIPAVSHRSDYQMFETRAAALDQAAFTLVDANLAWTLPGGKVRLGLHGKNLFDKEYRIGGYNFPGALFGDSVNAFYGPPRTVMLTARVSFE